MGILAVIIAVSFFVGVVCLAFAAVTEGGSQGFSRDRRSDRNDYICRYAGTLRSVGQHPELNGLDEGVQLGCIGRIMPIDVPVASGKRVGSVAQPTGAPTTRLSPPHRLLNHLHLTPRQAIEVVYHPVWRASHRQGAAPHVAATVEIGAAAPGTIAEYLATFYAMPASMVLISLGVSSYRR